MQFRIAPKPRIVMFCIFPLDNMRFIHAFPCVHHPYMVAENELREIRFVVGARRIIDILLTRHGGC